MWLLASLMLVLSACGSTAQLNGTSPEGTRDSGPNLDSSQTPTRSSRGSHAQGASTPTAPPDGAEASDRGLPPSAASDAAASDAEADAESSGESGEQGTSSATTGRASGRGFTPEVIRVGIGTNEDFDEVMANAGFSSGVGSQRNVYQAIIDHINERGGVAGRKLEPVYHDTPTARLVQDPDGSMQAACEKWTVDEPVFAAFYSVSTETLAACLAERQTVYLAGDLLRPERVFRKYAPYIFAPTTATYERIGRRWVGRMVGQSYFDGWDFRVGAPGDFPTKVGLLIEESRYGDDFERVMRTELEQVGHPVVEVARISGKPDRKADEVNRAALQFAEAEVTHVVTNAFLEFVLANFEQQRYRPRLSISTASLPRKLSTDRGVPKQQLMGTLGVGYIPTSDVKGRQDPGDLSPAETRCRTIMEDAGQDISSRDREWYVMRGCDAIFFLAAAIEAGGISATGMVQGATRMGDMPSASTFTILFEGKRADGAAGLRDLAYDANCDCMKYTSPEYGM